MTNPTALLRSFIIFAICLPLAILLGYTLAGPFDYTFVGVVGACIFVLLLPALLRFHHALLILGWNATMIVFFMPGNPGVWVPLVAFSFLISIIRRSIDRNVRFVSVPSLMWPLIVLAAVVLITAEARGGIRIRSLGGEFFGGKHYVLLLFAILGYFALTAQRIPPHLAGVYTGLFLLSGMTRMIGDVFYFRNPALQYIYWLFPPNTSSVEGGNVAQFYVTRFFGLNMGCLVLAYYMMAKYGIRELFSSQRPWRLPVFIVLVGLSTLGGFRSFLITLMLCFLLQFCFEGLHRTRLVLALVIVGALMMTITLPFVRRLPYSAQRALSFLPVPIDPLVRADADASSNWRLELWTALLPQVPEYFWLGKGYVFTKQDFDFAVNQVQGYRLALSQEESWTALSGDYHNGPLSVIIPFGVWGAAAFLWFLAASLRVLYLNYRYGDPNLRIVNAFLFAGYITRISVFMTMFGAFDGDIQFLVGYLGFSVSLNGGVCRRAPEPVRQGVEPQEIIPDSSGFQPAFQRSRLRP